MDLNPHPQPNLTVHSDLRMDRASAPSLDTETSKRILVQGGRNHLKILKPAPLLMDPQQPKRDVQHLEPQTLTRTVGKRNPLKSHPQSFSHLELAASTPSNPWARQAVLV